MLPLLVSDRRDWDIKDNRLLSHLSDKQFALMGLELATDATYRATIRQLRVELHETNELLEVAKDKIALKRWFCALKQFPGVNIRQLQAEKLDESGVKIRQLQRKLVINTTFADLMCFFIIIMVVTDHTNHFIAIFNSLKKFF